jgi:hypothetical protein
MADPQQLADKIAQIYQDAAKRLRETVIAPPGSTDSAREFNQARAAQLLNRVNAEVSKLKGQATQLAGEALTDAIKKGTAIGDAQATAAGLRPAGHLSGDFSVINHDAVRVLAQDTVGDLHKAADSMGKTAASALRRMAATGVTNAQVNDILAGKAVIEGQPAAAIRALRDELQKVHGETVVIQGKNGPIEFDTGYYAKLVAVTKTREAVVKGTNDRLQQRGIDLVKIVGRNSVHFCTAFLGHVYSLSGTSDKYPALSSLPNGGPPFHPQCSKSTAPFIEGLSSLGAFNQPRPDAA